MSKDDTEDINKSLRLMMRLIADLSLRVETCKVLLRSQGVTKEEFELAEKTLRDRWDAQSQPLLDQIKEKRTLEELHRLLESAKGTEQ